MRKILGCRRSTLALIALCFLTFLGFYKGTDVAMAISGIVLSVAGANAFETVGTTKKKDEGTP